MVRPIQTLLSVCCFALALTSTAAAVDWRDVAFPVKSHDFGTRAVAAKTEFLFPVVNTFGSDIHIKEVRASCGCTTPIIKNHYIQPNSTGYILARFNTGSFTGKKGATLTVVIDKPFFSEVRLEVKGYIRSDMVFHPGAVDFGSVDQGTTATKTSQILYAGRSDWKVESVRSNKPWLIPTVKQTLRGEGKVNYELSITIREDAPMGFFQDEVVVTTNDSSMPNVPLPVTGNIDSALVISPQSLALGSLKPGESMTKQLVVRGREPFTIDTIQADGWNIEFAKSDVARTTHLVSATFTPTDAAGPQKLPVKIKTGGKLSVSANALLTANVRDR
ncbi:DUF1573 domain-containing protein [Planctomycetes bacterium K23_9]|uniref:DUF1573 domain-containing protein n=1 Tax=Stieleria marina TaxID=1930275 RepID=A0A517NW61_9BACT|nr:hypothetical protein K239x_33570 [Planctomycetes bacterium K23_9]